MTVNDSLLCNFCNLFVEDQFPGMKGSLKKIAQYFDVAGHVLEWHL